MIKKILTVQLATFCIYILLYLIKTFVLWEFTNPFWWIINLPNYDNSQRAGILFGWIFYYLMWLPFLVGLNEKEKP